MLTRRQELAHVPEKHALANARVDTGFPTRTCANARSRRGTMYTDLALYVGGQWQNGDGRKAEDVINPATEKPLARLPHASRSDLDAALEAAQKGLQAWRAISPHDRAKVLRKAAALTRERADAIARIMTQEQGKI